MKVNQKKWERINPQKGNHIRVNRGFYYHHGVYISNKEVIHFTGKDADNILDLENNEVIKTDLAGFLRSGEVECRIYSELELNSLYPVDNIVMYARACLGDKGYNLIFNNCEHFANICTLGLYRSKQVEKFFKTIIGGISMGFFSKTVSLLKTAGYGVKNILSGGSNLSGSRSVSNTSYNPDEVRIAEIEKEKSLALADKEIKKINAKKEAELEIMRANEDMHLSIEEAKAKGLLLTAQAITRLQQNLNKLAEDSFKVIEGVSLEIVKEIENFYSDLEDKMKKDDIEYYKNKLPILKEHLESIDVESPMYDTFNKNIDRDISSHIDRHNQQIFNLSQRREKLIKSHIESKNKMIESTARITEKLTTNKLSTNEFLTSNNEKKKTSITKIENDNKK